MEFTTDGISNFYIPASHSTALHGQSERLKRRLSVKEDFGRGVGGRLLVLVQKESKQSISMHHNYKDSKCVLDRTITPMEDNGF